MWSRLGRALGDDGPMARSLGAVVLVAAWVSTWRPQVDPDAWWHIALGEAIVKDRALPGIEPFSWLTAGDRFVAHSWLWDVLMATAYRLVGPSGTSLLVLPVTALVVAALWALIKLVAPDVPPIPRALAVAVAMSSSVPLWAPRTQTLDVLFVLVTLLLIARYVRLGSRYALAGLPLLALAWANLHGSAVLALTATLVIGLIALPMGVRLGTWPSRPWWPLAAWSLAASAALVISPYGPALLAYPFDRAVASAFSTEIVEWRPPDFRAPELQVARAVLAGSIVLVAALGERRRDPLVLMAAAAWSFLALGAVRFLPLASILVIAAVSPLIGSVIARRSDPPSQVPDYRAGPRVSFVVLAVVIGAVLLGIGWTFIAPRAQVAAISHRLPIAAIDRLEAAACDGRLLPAYGWAGYVILEMDRPVGAYGNSPEVPLADQAAVESVAKDPRPWLDTHDVAIAVMPVGGGLSHWLDEAHDWRLAYRDAQATIHVRADRDGCQP